MEIRQKDGLKLTLNEDIYKADPCLICGLTEKSHYLYGDFIVAVSSSTPAIKCHYFCLVLYYLLFNIMDINKFIIFS